MFRPSPKREPIYTTEGVHVGHVELAKNGKHRIAYDRYYALIGTANSLDEAKALVGRHVGAPVVTRARRSAA